MLRLASEILMQLRFGLEVRRDRRRLHMMPDYILKDMGIDRAEIDYLPSGVESPEPRFAPAAIAVETHWNYPSRTYSRI